MRVRSRKSWDRALWMVAVTLWLSACRITEGPLLVRADAAVGDAGPNHPQLRAAVRPNMSLQYQLTGELDTSVDAQLFVIDLFETSAAQVDALHASGRIVIAYVSAGSLESWRPDADRLASSVVGNALGNYPNEKWLDIRSQSVRSLMMARMQRALDKGFDGLFLSTLGAYRANSGFALSRADELDYDRFLTTAAHARGLSAGLSGDFELSSELVRDFDWVLANGCIAASSCDMLRPWLTQGKAVFDLETQGTHDEVCTRAATYGVAATRKHDPYDAWRMPCP